MTFRFHEKESLQRMVREATSQPGVLYAFIVLDNPENSILDMQVCCNVSEMPCTCDHGFVRGTGSGEDGDFV